MTTGDHTVRYILYQVLGLPLVGIREYIDSQRLTTRLADEVIPFQDRAYDVSREHKEGEYILERNLLVRVR